MIGLLRRGGTFISNADTVEAHDVVYTVFCQPAFDAFVILLNRRLRYYDGIQYMSSDYAVMMAYSICR